jgi:integrase
MGSEIKLTKRSVEAVPVPGAGQNLEAWDSELRGFHVRVSASGNRTFRLFYRFGGRQRVATIGKLSGALTVEQARSRAKALLGEIIAGRDPIDEAEKASVAAAEERRRALTVSELINVYLTEAPPLNPTKRQSSWEYDRHILRNHVEPVLGKLQVGAVRRVDVERMVAAVRAGKTAREAPSPKKRGRIRVRGGEAAGRGALTILRVLFRWAMLRELVAADPTMGVAKPRPVKKERFLSVDEIGRLLKTINEMEAEGALLAQFANVLRLLLMTGCRKQEILRLMWSEVDLQRALITLPPARSKTGARTIALSPPAIAVLTGLARPGTAVFPSPRDPNKPIEGLQSAWERVRARAGLKDVRIHDLRHTFASLAVGRGASLLLVARALGHAQASTTERYSHFSDDPRRRLAEDVGQAILEAMQARPENVVALRRK